MPLTYPTSLTQGTTANATDVQGMFDAITTLLNTTKLDNSYIVSGTLSTTQLSSSANITASQLASTTAGYVLLGLTSTGVPTWTPLTGDVTVTGGGVTAIGASKVTNAMLAGSITEAKITAGTLTTASLSATAGITSGQMALANGKINIGSAGGVGAAQTLTGDVTVTNGGVTAIGASKVLTAMINNNAVTSDKLSVTTSEVRATNNTQGLTGSFVDIVGLDTGTITPPTGATQVEVDVSVCCGGFTLATAFYIAVWESDNAASFTDLTQTYGTGSASGNNYPGSLATGATQEPTVACSFSRSITSGHTLRYKVQIQGSQNNGNVLKNIATFVRWRFIK